MLRALLLSLSLLLASCQAEPQIKSYFNPADSMTMLFWRDEARARFPGREVVLIGCHGTSFGGLWFCRPFPKHELRPVADVVRENRARFPDAVLVLLICNPGGHSLPEDLTDIAYALDNIWMLPDGNQGLDWDTALNLNAIGDINEFRYVPKRDAGGHPLPGNASLPARSDP